MSHFYFITFLDQIGKRFAPKGFLDKTGRGVAWSPDTDINIIKVKLEDFLVMFGPKLLAMGYLENTFN